MTSACANWGNGLKSTSLQTGSRRHARMLAGALALIGFSMGLCSVGVAQEMCTIQGEQGACKIEAFLGSESKNDRDGFTCTKLNGVKYKGACYEGDLDGMILFNRPANRHFGRNQDDQFLAMVKAGQVQYPVAKFSEQIVGVMDKEWSTGCVNFAQGWDQSTDKLCALLTNCRIPDDHMVACGTDVGEMRTTLSSSA